MFGDNKNNVILKSPACLPNKINKKDRLLHEKVRFINYIVRMILVIKMGGMKGKTAILLSDTQLTVKQVTKSKKA
jgi:hypothetical protein